MRSAQGAGADELESEPMAVVAQDLRRPAEAAANAIEMFLAEEGVAEAEDPRRRTKAADVGGQLCLRREPGETGLELRVSGTPVDRECPPPDF